MLKKVSYVLIFIFLFFLVCIGTLYVGTVPFKLVFEGALDRVFNGSQKWNPLLDERIPRLIVLICSGGGLSLCGAVMQSIFRNPLASPGILGVNAGGIFGGTLALILGWHLGNYHFLPLFTFFGCLFTLLLVWAIASLISKGYLLTLIFSGMAVGTVITAIDGALMFSLRHNWQLTQMIIEWKSASTLDRSWDHVLMQLPLCVLGIGGVFYLRKEIDLLSLGHDDALNFGVCVSRVKGCLFILIAVIVGSTLAAMGEVPFFALVLPHTVRWIQGRYSKTFLSKCFLLGCFTLPFLDLLLRVFGVTQFTIGNLSSLVGGIFFLLLLVFKKQEIRL
jgi:iron complex transport system permease protein